MKLSVFWFRRDLRLEDNTALNHALLSGNPVLPIFIFDVNILDELPRSDARVTFIYDTLLRIDEKLRKDGIAIKILRGEPLQLWNQLTLDYEIEQVFINSDYEPYACERDDLIKSLLESKGIVLHQFKDQVIFEKDDVVKDNLQPYTVFTPFKKKWLSKYGRVEFRNDLIPNQTSFYRENSVFPTLKELGFVRSSMEVRNFDLSRVDQYALHRDIPSLDATSYLGTHLRFGTVSVRQIIRQLYPKHEVLLGELVWREFFMQILWHFPEVINHSFKPQYDRIQWRNDENDFARWCNGTTGYPMVDAGMRQLNETGFMHNRVRMVTASFLCKHLLIDWRWGEAYFAEKLLDYELASNNGNWQWAAGTGCDAAPYFRIFNPTAQQVKFDKGRSYVRKWIPELDTPEYGEPIIDHKYARERALRVYKAAVGVK